MPFDSQGNFTRVMNWQEDAANSVPIVASRHDDEDDNFAQGFNNTLCRDGRAAMTGALKMGNFKITGLGNGTTANDAVNKSQLDAQNTSLTTAINTAISTMLSNVYPVGSLYIGTQSTCPMASLISGSTWELVPENKALWTGNGSNGNTTKAAGLPNIEGTLSFYINSNGSLGVVSPNQSGLFQATGDYNSRYSQPVSGGGLYNGANFNASRVNSIYGNSNTVQPPAYVVNVWRRTA